MPPTQKQLRKEIHRLKYLLKKKNKVIAGLVRYMKAREDHPMMDTFASELEGRFQFEVTKGEAVQMFSSKAELHERKARSYEQRAATITPQELMMGIEEDPEDTSWQVTYGKNAVESLDAVKKNLLTKAHDHKVKAALARFCAEHLASGPFLVSQVELQRHGFFE